MTASFTSHYIRTSAEVISSLERQQAQIEDVASLLVKVITDGGRIYTCGNGGSSCDSMHFVEELVARYKRERPGIPAHHLLDASVMSCWSNDYSYEGVFARQVETLLTERDALVVFSTSGNSANIVQALRSASTVGATTIALLGRDGGSARPLADHAIVVASEVTSQIQEAH
ncbi:MAG: SIS domain-containing protein, partial [Bdellovibrionales bacterium]|nr:SIS domain-containing protein [Bdellovibrionales bacterium]